MIIIKGRGFRLGDPMNKKDDAWFAKHFPTTQARAKADEAIDKVDPKEATFLDVWITEYIQADGKTKLSEP